MRVPFTKMQGAGNDFVVLDETRGRLGLSAAQFRFLGDRHFGVGADQILSVLPSPAPGIDFEYVIHNADGGEVEHCGNGARCFLKFVRQQGLTTQDLVTVQTMNRVLALQWQPDARVTVDMQAPVFDLAPVPFNPGDWGPLAVNGWSIWPFAHGGIEYFAINSISIDSVTNLAIVSMGNPHAVTVVDDVDATPVHLLGPQIQLHPAFTQGVNVGFMQVVNRSRIRLRVYERGAGETLACGTGACAAVVSGIRLGLLDDSVDVQTRGGQLTVQWSGGDAPVMMTGPAETVFHGEIDIPENL